MSSRWLSQNAKKASLEVKDSLERIEKKNGLIKPEMVVEEAEDESSPLHDFFEWDDDRASELYRLAQARVLINAVRVQIEGKTQKGFFNVKVQTNSGEQKGYVSLNTVVQNQSFYDQVVDNALTDLKRMEQRYENLDMLKPFLSGAIEKLESERKAKK